MKKTGFSALFSLLTCVATPVSGAYALSSASPPVEFSMPWGAGAGSAYIQTPIPATPTGTVGQASLQTGFPVANDTPVAAGGVPPRIQDFNGIFNQITATDQWLQAGGNFPYNSSFATSAGGYPKGAVIPSSSVGGFWLNTSESNVSNPDTGGAGWLRKTLGMTTLQAFTASGTWTCPAGVTRIYAVVLGGGAGGGGSASGNDAAGGGASGDYDAGFLNVTPGTAYSVTLGAGGTGASGNSTATGGYGGTTSLANGGTSLIYAGGGLGGMGAAAGTVGAGGPPAGNAGGGQLGAAGGGGASGANEAGTAIYLGGAGGPMPFTAGYTPGNFGQGIAGFGPGGGGSGGANGGGGGGGAAGELLIEY